MFKKSFEKYITFMFIPHEETGMKTKRVSYGYFYLALVLVIAIMVALAFVFIDYRNQFVQKQNYEALKAENEVLRNRVENLKNASAASESAIMGILDSVDNLLVVNNLPPMSPFIKEMGVGGIPPMNPEDVETFQLDPVLKSEIENISVSLSTTERRLMLAREQLRKISENAQLKEQNWDNVPTNWPVYGWITCGFGRRISPLTFTVENHTGIDIAQSTGAEILSPGNGVVSFAGWRNGYGKTVDIEHSYGIQTRYGHMDSINVSVGQKVKKGEIIGRVGSTGWSVGSHLHYEVRIFGTPVDPLDWILSKKD